MSGDGTAVKPASIERGAEPRREVRLPLQVGTTSLWSLARAGAAFVPALALIVVSVAVDHAFDGSIAPPIFPQDVCLALGGLLGLYAFVHTFYAWRERPSDVLIDASGLRVEGGAHAGAWARWEALDRAACHLERAEEHRVTLRGIATTALLLASTQHPLRPVEIARLVVVARGMRPQILARAETPDEERSLHALLHSIQSGPWSNVDEEVERRAHDAKRRQAALGIEVIECPGCGAPTPPVERDLAKCRYCGDDVPIPAEMIRRLEASRRVVGGRETIDATLARLLHQPGADAIFRRLAVVAAIALATGAAAVFFVWLRASNETVTLLDITLLPLVPLLTVCGAFAFVRRTLVDRQALRLVAVSFAARAPLRAGDPHTCRRCAGPLPERADEIAVRCVYCNADNVLGTDLGNEVAPTEAQASTLEDALAIRDRDASRWERLRAPGVGAWVAAAAVLVLGAGASARLMRPLGATEPGAPRLVSVSSTEPAKKPRFDALFAPLRPDADPRSDAARRRRAAAAASASSR